MKKQKSQFQNEEEIKAYIKKNNIDATRSDSGLYYSITNQGKGTQPTRDSNITIGYIGYLTDGTIFDKSESLEINLSVVIEGWKEGIQHFKEGGEGILIIPAHLGYGNTDYGSIPGGSVLVFDLELQEVIS